MKPVTLLFVACLAGALACEAAAQAQQESASFPPSPDAASFPPTNFGASSYPASGQSTEAAVSLTQNDMPLPPPNDFREAERAAAPFTEEEVILLRRQLEAMRKAKAFKPVHTLPQIRSVAVDLSPNSVLPVARTVPGEMTTLVFIDVTGAPWPLAIAPRVSDTRFFDAEWVKDTPSVVLSALSPYEKGNLTVFLQGLATPVVVRLEGAPVDDKDRTRAVDYRLDLRVPGRSPNAKPSAVGADKIALYDDVMQDFLNGTPPSDAVELAMTGDVPAQTKIWQRGDSLFLRTSLDIRTAFDRTMASGDGTRIYQLAPTPYVTLSDRGRAVTLQVDIN
jgi:intracellular multiplication protein IcmK